MTVRDALKAVSAEGRWLVSYRAMITLLQRKRKVDSWIGNCKYEDGKLLSTLSGEVGYSLDEEIERYKKIDGLPGGWDGGIVVYIKTK